MKRRFMLLLATWILVAPACGGGAENAERPGSPVAGTPGSSTSGTPSPSPSPQGTGGHYQGTEVAFDFPQGWHEFNLEVSVRFYAAYGPVSGGGHDYIAVAPVPAVAKGLPPGQILVGPPQRKGSVVKVDVNGMPGYSVAVSGGKTLKGEETLVQGKRGDYLVTCQYEAKMSELVPIGCQMLKDTLVEVPPPVITDPSGCTGNELALLRSVPMPSGTDPGEPKMNPAGGQRVCDLMVRPSQPSAGYTGDLVGYFRAQLTSAGWRVEKAKVDRTSGPFQVWQVLGDKDWDFYLVEIYVDPQGVVVAKGAAQNFFVTVFDG